MDIYRAHVLCCGGTGCTSSGSNQIIERFEEKIKEAGEFSSLADDLKQVANLREDNPESSLKEIGELCSPSMSRSAVNHRLKKLIEIAQKLEQSTED